jgi:hypothetical protein
MMAVDDRLAWDEFAALVSPWLQVVAERKLLPGELEIPASERRAVKRLGRVRNRRAPFSEEVQNFSESVPGPRL